jgi:hypothetical protein
MWPYSAGFGYDDDDDDDDENVVKIQNIILGNNLSCSSILPTEQLQHYIT